MMNKKGMGIGQVFTFMVAAITFSVIMIFGYGAIEDLRNTGVKTEFIQFKTTLEKSVKNIYTEYGAIRKEKIKAPSSIKQICFVDLDYQFTAQEKQQLCQLDAFACDSLEEAENAVAEGRCDTGYDCLDQNVFLFPSIPDTGAIKVYKIKVYDIESEEMKGFICQKIVQGTLHLILEGKGDHTEISALPTAAN